jgi:hypothetical protein
MYTYQGHVKLPTGVTTLMEVRAPDNYTALQMLRAYGVCLACAPK